MTTVEEMFSFDAIGDKIATAKMTKMTVNQRIEKEIVPR